MPFPPLQVLLDYLELYSKARSGNRDSLFIGVKTLGERLLKPLIGTQIVVDELDDRIAEVKAMLTSAENSTTNKFDAWINAIFQLRVIAKECHELKKLDGESLLCQVLHGLASLILRCLEDDPIFSKKLEQEINTRIKSLAELHKQASDIMRDRNGSGIDAVTDAIKMAVTQLASLSINGYIFDSKLYHLFDYLPHLSERDTSNLTKGKANCIGLIQLQKGFDQLLYEMQFQRFTTIGFHEFITRSIETDVKQKEIAAKLALQSTQAKIAADETAAAAAAAAGTPSLSSTGLFSSSLSSQTGSVTPTAPAAAKAKGKRPLVTPSDDGQANPASAASPSNR